MWRRWILAVPVLVAGCGSADAPSSAHGEAAEDEDAVLIYEGRYFVLPDPDSETEAAPAPDGVDGAPALADGAFVGVELDLTITCEGVEPSGLGWSMGTMTVGRSDEELSLTPMVMLSRDGLSGVTAADWAAYQASTPAAPVFAGAVTGLALGFEDEDWSLVAAGDPEAAYPVAALTGTTVVDGQVCAASGSLLLLPVAAEEHVGALILDPVDDDE